MPSSSMDAPLIARKSPRFRRARLLQAGVVAFAFYTAALAFPLLALTIAQSERDVSVSAGPESVVVGQAEPSSPSPEDLLRKDAEIQKLTEALKQAVQAKAAAEHTHAQWLQWLKTADRKQIDAQIAKMRAAAPAVSGGS